MKRKMKKGSSSESLVSCSAEIWISKETKMSNQKCQPPLSHIVYMRKVDCKGVIRLCDQHIEMKIVLKRGITKLQKWLN